MKESIWDPVFQIGKLRLRSNTVIDGLVVRFNSERLLTTVTNAVNKNIDICHGYCVYAVYTKPVHHMFGLIKSEETIFVNIWDVDPASGEINNNLNINEHCSYQGLFVTSSDNSRLINKCKINTPRSEYYRIKHLFKSGADDLQLYGTIFNRSDYHKYRDFCDFCRGVIITDTTASNK